MSVRWLAFPLIALIAPAVADEVDPRGLEYFESKIRPVLVQHCYECHSAGAEEVKAGLRVDSRAGLLNGGDSGPALMAGKPDESLILRALRGDEYTMPPDGLLPAEVVADFEKWIAMGAPDPREGDASDVAEPQIDLAAGRQFWSFRPLSTAAVPAPADASWCTNEIDRFIRTRHEQAGLTPGPDADRRVLARRAHFDLIGLPPSPDELAAFVADDSPQAWPQLIDRLLESPHFGERWGRHWLDISRYADSTGGGRSMLYGASWRYRDYVINAFNRDKPFDRFIIEQIAGDLLPFGDLAAGAEQLTATAFLALGPSNYEEQDKEVLRMDVIDEQIDTVGRAFLGMTLGCARCHDHKFDPVPTTDYYALAGIFRSTQTLIHENVSTWVKRPLPVSAERRAKLDEFARRRPVLDDEIKDLRKRLKGCEGYLRYLTNPGQIVLDDEDEEFLAQYITFTGNWTASSSQPQFVGDEYRYASGPGAAATYTFEYVKACEYEIRVSYNAHPNRSPNALIRIEHDGTVSDVRVDQRMTPPIDGRYISVGRVTATNHPVTVTISTQGADGIVVADAVILQPTSPPAVHEVSVRKARDELVAAQDALKAKQAELAAITVESPPEVMSVQDESKCGDFAVCLRGSVHHLGSSVPRGFLSVVSETSPTIAAGSGRTELAHWIASPDNPLTSRVYVNRVWAHLFGRGLVPTVDNFGATGEPPSHPELLDWLAARFMSQGWSTKSLIRDIMLSRTYQLASTGQSSPGDPDNALLTRQNRKRLEVECLHDAMLSLSGELDLTVGGDTVRTDTKKEYGYEFDIGRRAVYLPVFRNQLPPGFAEFDFPDPNLSIGRRTTTTLSTQALLLMNSPLAIERAKRAAALLIHDEPDQQERLTLLFERALGRPPTDAERQLANDFVGGAESGDEIATRWTELCLSVIGSIDFRYIE